MSDPLRRWRESEPNDHLTWGLHLDGIPFMSAVADYIRPTVRIVEIGPGYARLFLSALKLKMRWASWTGVDISPATAAYCRTLGMDVLEGEASTMELPAHDLMLSSLVFKHQSPDWGALAANVRTSLTPGGYAIFDLPHAGHPMWLVDDRPGWDYCRAYTEPEVADLVHAAGYHDLVIGRVAHTPERVRMLVIAQA